MLPLVWQARTFPSEASALWGDLVGREECHPSVDPLTPVGSEFISPMDDFMLLVPDSEKAAERGTTNPLVR